MSADSGARRDNLVLAIATILFTVFALALGDAVIKSMSQSFPLWQIFVLRSVLVLPVLGVLMRVGPQPVALRLHAPGWTLLRSVMLMAMWVAYYASLPHVPLSAAAAVYYTLPLFITLFASLFLAERVGPLGWIAVFLGFVGVLLILDPQAEDFNAYALLPLASAVLYALAMILTRSKCRGEHPLMLSLALNGTFVAAGLLTMALLSVWAPSEAERGLNPFLFGAWSGMDAEAWLVMGVLAAAILIGSVGAAIAYQSAPASTVSTFDFAYLAFAALWGFVFFAELPTPMALLGTGLIVAAGIMTLRR